MSYLSDNSLYSYEKQVRSKFPRGTSIPILRNYNFGIDYLGTLLSQKMIGINFFDSKNSVLRKSYKIR